MPIPEWVLSWIDRLDDTECTEDDTIDQAIEIYSCDLPLPLSGYRPDLIIVDDLEEGIE